MASRTALTIMRRARTGDVAMQYQLGRLYLDGEEGVGASESAAYLWLARAAAAGHAPAWELIGEQIAPSAAAGDRRLAEWYERAASAGSAVAQLRLARLLLARGDDATVNAKRVVWLLWKSVEGGSSEACFELGRLKLTRTARETERHEGCRLLEQAWEQGVNAAGSLLAEHYWQRRDAERACLWYERCMEPDDAEACYRLGMLETLLGRSGIELLERAADAGHPEACEELGVRYAAGAYGSRRNLKKAARRLERSADGGSVRACFLLAMIYRHPHSVVHDRRQARAWLFRAARAGHAEACLRAGIVLVRDLEAGRRLRPSELGEDEPDLLAVRWLRLAERHGMHRASAYLARVASRAQPSSVGSVDEWDDFLDAVREVDQEIAVRLNVGHTLGLTAIEMLTLDLEAGDLGDCLVINLPTRGARQRRRIVLIDTAEQRDCIDEARRVLGPGNQPSRPMGRPENQAVTRQRRLRRISRQASFAGIDAVLFPRGERETRQDGSRRACVASGPERDRALS